MAAALFGPIPLAGGQDGQDSRLVVMEHERRARSGPEGAMEVIKADPQKLLDPGFDMFDSVAEQVSIRY
jgi:hypothetical protein